MLLGKTQKEFSADGTRGRLSFREIEGGWTDRRSFSELDVETGLCYLEYSLRIRVFFYIKKFFHIKKFLNYETVLFVNDYYYFFKNGGKINVR